MQILAAVGWILLALLLVMILAVALPAKVLVDWRGGKWTLKARVLFLTFRLYPRHRRKRAEEAHSTPAGAPEGTAEKPAAESPQPGTAETAADGGKKTGETQTRRKRRIPWNKIAHSIRTAGGFVRRVLRFVHVDDIELCLPVHEEDAAQTAIQYGRIQASLGALIAALRNVVRLDFKKVNIFADFDGVCEKQTAFSCKIGAPPVIIAIAAIWAYLRLTEAEVL